MLPPLLDENMGAYQTLSGDSDSRFVLRMNDCTWNCSYGVPQYNAERGVVGKCDMCC
jgi:hypothetical protein